MRILKKVYYFSLALIMFVVLVIGPISVVITNVYGKTQTVTVSFHKRLLRGKKGPPIIVSRGYYYVNGKRYFAQIEGKHPIGTKFDLKYNPIIPWEHNIIGIIQE